MLSRRLSSLPFRGGKDFGCLNLRRDHVFEPVFNRIGCIRERMDRYLFRAAVKISNVRLGLLPDAGCDHFTTLARIQDSLDEAYVRGRLPEAAKTLPRNRKDWCD